MKMTPTKQTFYTIVMVMAFGVIASSVSQPKPKPVETSLTSYVESGQATVYFPAHDNPDELESRTTGVEAGVGNLFQVWRAYAGLPEEVRLLSSSLFAPDGLEGSMRISVDLSADFLQVLTPENEQALIHALVRTLLENYFDPSIDSAVVLTINTSPLVTERRDYSVPLTLEFFAQDFAVP